MDSDTNYFTVPPFELATWDIGVSDFDLCASNIAVPRGYSQCSIISNSARNSTQTEDGARTATQSSESAVQIFLCRLGIFSNK